MSDYIDIDALFPNAYEEDDYIVITDATAYNPFTGLLNIDQLESSSPSPTPAQHYIYIGDVDTPTLFFDPTNLVSVNSNTGIDPIGNELTIDTLEFEVYWQDDGTLAGLTYATPIWCYRGSAFVGKFYFKTIERYGINHWKVSAVSVIGLLEYEPHYGGTYTARNAKSAITEAFLSNGIDSGNLQQYSSVRSTGGTITSVPLAQNCLGADEVGSGTKSGIFLQFVVYGATYNSEQVVWRSFIDEYGTLEDTYDVGVTVKKTNNTSGNTSITVSIYCNYGEFGADPVTTFTANYGDEIGVLIRPWQGFYAYYGTNTSYTSGSFTAFTVNERIPLYSSLGVYYANDTLDYMTTTLDYELKQLVIYGNSSQTFSSQYLNVAFLKDIGNNDIYFSNSRTGYKTLVSGYQVVGDPLPSADDTLTELYDVVDNIQWPANIESMTVSGWIGASTKREVLHQLLFALNLNLFKSADGNIIINQLPAETEKTITNDETYNKGSTEDVASTRLIELTEHSYTASGSTQTVFDNSDATVGNDDYVILFDSPIYGTPTAGSGITIKAYNANAAVVNGKGAITAQTYLHSQRVIKQAVSSRPDGGTVSVSGATLVTFLNASSVMNKLLAYYNNGCYKTKNSILTSAMCARKYQFPAPFGGNDTGYLIGANSVGSAVTKTNCTFLSNFTPVSIGNDYNNYQVLTGSGTFTLPTGVTKIHVVMVGGGSGGASGFAGANGGANSYWNSSTPARGGNYGANGSGGKVYEVEISSPSSSYNYSCGTGGAGGAICTSTSQNNAGSAGTASTFGNYSSASGSVRKYTNILNGDLLAGDMPKWNDESGKGGDGGAKTINDSSHPTQITTINAGSAYNFMTGLSYSGGSAGINSGIIDEYQWVGGSGGGAALNANGSRGGDYSIINNTQVVNAVGGNGANATYVPPKATTYNSKYYGYGGMGGCGGGGGGSAGYDGAEQTTFTGGTGGYGGKGGDGGDGCIIVYY